MYVVLCINVCSMYVGRAKRWVHTYYIHLYIILHSLSVFWLCSPSLSWLCSLFSVLFPFWIPLDPIPCSFLVPFFFSSSLLLLLLLFLPPLPPHSLARLARLARAGSGFFGILDHKYLFYLRINLRSEGTLRTALTRAFI